MFFVRQFVIAFQRAGLAEVSVVTFSNDNHGVMRFEAGSSVDVVVNEMYDAFAEEQLQHSRTQSENAPNRNAEWRQVRLAQPPREAFLSTAAPVGDPNSLLRANDVLRLPDVRNEVIVAPRTPPKRLHLHPLLSLLLSQLCRKHHPRHHQHHPRGRRISRILKCPDLGTARHL